jgi:hypothetical protein
LTHKPARGNRPSIRLNDRASGICLIWIKGGWRSKRGREMRGFAGTHDHRTF